MVLRAVPLARLRRGLTRPRGQQDLVRPVQVAPAALAHLVVDVQDGAALLAAPPRLVALPAVEQGGDRADDRQHRAYDEPEEERRALDARDHPGREAEEERYRDVGAAVGHATQDTSGTRASEQLAERPDHRDYKGDDQRDPGQAGEDAENELQQDPGGYQQNAERQGLHSDIGGCFAHVASMPHAHAGSLKT